MMMAVLKRSKWPEDPQVNFLNDGFYLFFWWGNNFICSFKSLNDIQIHFIRCLCTYIYNSQLFFFFASSVLFLLMWVECLKFSLQIKKLYVFFFSIVDVFYIWFCNTLTCLCIIGCRKWWLCTYEAR